MEKKTASVATIADVAARANVSTATVSRVLNGKKVRADLTTSVQRAAQELGYSPNRAARTLRRRMGDVIALILPDIENPFFTSLARGVEDVAQQHGYSVVLCNSDDDVEKEARYLRIAVSDHMAGVIICPADEATSLESVMGRVRSAVVVDRLVHDDVDQVVLDNAAISRQAVRALIDAGYTRIACVTSLQNTLTGRTRAEVWRSELLAAGLPAPDELLVHTNFRVEGGRHATEQLLSLPQRPDAILAANNMVAVGILQVLAEHRLRTRDIGVSVIGSLPFATSRMADIPVVPLHPREMGLAAARMLFERMNGTVSGPGRRVMLNGAGDLRALTPVTPATPGG